MERIAQLRPGDAAARLRVRHVRTIVTASVSSTPAPAPAFISAAAFINATTKAAVAEMLVADASGSAVLQVVDGWVGRVESAAAEGAWMELTNVGVDVQRGQIRLVLGPWSEMRVLAEDEAERGPTQEQVDLADEHNISNRVYVRPIAPVTASAP